MFSKTTATLAAFCLINNYNPFVKADQPVHCLRDDVFGDWEFTVNTQTENVNLYQANEVCTHQSPNKVQIISKDHEFKFAKSETYKLKLDKDYKVTA